MDNNNVLVLKRRIAEANENWIDSRTYGEATFWRETITNLEVRLEMVLEGNYVHKAE